MSFLKFSEKSKSGQYERLLDPATPLSDAEEELKTALNLLLENFTKDSPRNSNQSVISYFQKLGVSIDSTNPESANELSSRVLFAKLRQIPESQVLFSNIYKKINELCVEALSSDAKDKSLRFLSEAFNMLYSVSFEYKSGILSRRDDAELKKLKTDFLDVLKIKAGLKFPWDTQWREGTIKLIENSLLHPDVNPYEDPNFGQLFCLPPLQTPESQAVVEQALPAPQPQAQLGFLQMLLALFAQILSKLGVNKTAQCSAGLFKPTIKIDSELQALISAGPGLS
jgi:hypothetical protein